MRMPKTNEPPFDPENGVIQRLNWSKLFELTNSFLVEVISTLFYKNLENGNWPNTKPSVWMRGARMKIIAILPLRKNTGIISDYS